jgi:small subunit ribosomal protein S20
VIEIPNIKSAKKRMRQNATRRERNLARRGALKKTVKQVKKAVEAGDKNAAQALVPELMKVADKAAKHNVIHANKAARLKSRLVKRIQALA